MKSTGATAGGAASLTAAFMVAAFQVVAPVAGNGFPAADDIGAFDIGAFDIGAEAIGADDIEALEIGFDEIGFDEIGFDATGCAAAFGDTLFEEATLPEENGETAWPESTGKACAHLTQRRVSRAFLVPQWGQRIIFLRKRKSLIHRHYNLHAPKSKRTPNR